MKQNLILLGCLLAVVCTVTAGAQSFGIQGVSDPLQPAIAGKILRFHVMANSDGEGDQQLKLKVRDMVGAYLEPLLADADSVEDTRRIVNANLDGILDTAQKTIAEEGYSYGVKARLAHTDFPEKTYGTYTFPAGEYEALEVTIGEGDGHNWWCVLYPNMCFRGSVYEVADTKAGEALQEVLSPEEYKDVVDSGDFQVRFKFLDWIRGLQP